MTYRRLRPLMAGLLLCLGTGAHAATFLISISDDVSQEDECSLRDAFIAITQQEERNACPAGTGNDVIRLQAGEVYQLDSQLVLGGFIKGVPQVDAEGDPVPEDGCDPDDPPPGETECPQKVVKRAINPSVRIETLLRNEDNEDAPNPVIRAASGARVLWLRRNAALTLDSVELHGCAPADPADVTCDVPVDELIVAGEYEDEDETIPKILPPDGGLLLLDGRLTARNAVTFRGGHARHGGALFVRENVTVTLQNSRLTHNVAAGQGGAIAVYEDFGNILALSRFYMAENHAATEGGGVALPGGIRSPRLLMANGTLLRNTAGSGGAAVHVGMAEDDDPDEPTARAPVLDLANLTLVENSSADVDGSGLFIDSIGESDVVSNTVLVANLPRDCAGAGLEPSVTEGILFAYTATSDTGCPDPGIFQFPGNSGYANAADISVLRNLDGPCGAGCEPIADEDARFDLPGFLPNFEADPVLNGLPRLVDGGSPETSAEFVCESDDQRGFRREDRCDIGAFEFRRAQGEPDSINLVIGRTELLDVVANDLRDSTIDCGLLAPGTPCLWVVQRSTRDAVMTPVIDDDGYPRLEYQFTRHYDGYDFFAYQVNRDAIVGETFGDNNIGARVAVLARPETGMTRSRNIDDFGGVQPFWLLGLVLAGLLRCGRAHRRIPVGLLACVALFGLPTLVNAAEIRVNQLTDETDPEPVAGQCSLREAILSAIDKLPNSTGCANGMTGEDRIVLPAGTVTLVAPLEVGQNNRVIIEGEGPDKTFIEAGGAFRLLEHRSRVTLRNLTLRGGDAQSGNGGAIQAFTSLMLDNVRLEDNSAVNGGAVYLNFSADERRQVVIRRSFFVDNQASGHGGALAMVAQREDHDLEISNSTFADNSAGDMGGALDIRGGERMRTRLINNTFVGNSAVQGGAAIDFNGYAGNANIISATMVDNSGPAQMDLGNLPADPNVEAGNITLSNSILAATSQACSLGDRRLTRSVYNLFADAIDPSCEPTAANGNTGNETGARAGIVTSLNNGVLVVADEVAEEDWLQPHLPITDTDDDLIVDAANPADLSSGTGSVDACRSTDLRGRSRAAGDRCDRGAFEFQQATARDDQGNNANRRTRTVRLDVLGNDIAGEDGIALRRGTLTLITGDGDELAETVGEAFVRQRRADPEDDESVQLQYDDVIQVLSSGDEYEHYAADIDDPIRECGMGLNLDGSQNNADDDPDTRRDDDCVVVYRFRQPTPLVTCGDLPFKDRFRYAVDVDRYTLVTDPDTGEETRVWDDTPETVSAMVEVSISNVPPIVPRTVITRHIEPGGDVTIHLLDEGVRESDFSIVGMRLRENASPLFARRALDNTIEGTGVIFDDVNFTVTYRHGDNSKRFTDTFTVQLRDECGDTSDVRFKITFPQQNAAGGELVGPAGLLMLWLVLLGGWRRRLRTPC
ncbi:CSLREA domain-containing protein [Isoalcanivorax indicus]|uniref:CSLREA domain-containing protein n=1 Tax=Isoalcanivorax indicus TaxID=2202653 RepID=UPI0013C42A78|nr:CSLREA domain-containing protein [Isoalcanivorax indicus]